MAQIHDTPFSTAPATSLEEHLSSLPRVKQREGQILFHLLRQRPLSALQQFSTLQKALLASGLSDEGEQDLYLFLMVLSYHTYCEALHPLYARTATLDSVMFWDACVELEVPLLLMELLARPAIFSMVKYRTSEKQNASTPVPPMLSRTHSIV